MQPMWKINLIRKQARLESGNYRCSNCRLDENNIFGMRYPSTWRPLGYRNSIDFVSYPLLAFSVADRYRWELRFGSDNELTYDTVLNKFGGFDGYASRVRNV